jgi:hypothetical protein
VDVDSFIMKPEYSAEAITLPNDDASISMCYEPIILQVVRNVINALQPQNELANEKLYPK